MREKLQLMLAKLVSVLPIIFAALILCGFVAAGAYYTYKNKPSTTDVTKKVIKDAISDAKQAAQQVATDPEAEKKAEEFTKNPPKTSSGKISTKSVSTSAGSAMVMSTGGGDDTSKIQSLATSPATSSFKYVDATGNYPDLGNTIRDYLNNTLLRAGEISYLYEVDLIDCPDCTYGGYWTGSYIYQGDDIIKAFGYITLNIGPYKDSAYKIDYMKLIFSHEYGHHYTMYHRWVDQDIPSGERFASDYYSVRPLGYGDTATDYSLGWANCDAEIIAEDYSYFYSGYGYSGVASAHGYPSNPATKNYLVAMSTSSVPSSPAEVPTNPEETTPSLDNEAPTVSITAPGNGAAVSGTISVSATANDNTAVSKVDFYVDSQLIASDTSAPYVSDWDSKSLANGAHSITVKAYDAAGNMGSSAINIVVNNTVAADSEAPAVTITEPAGSSYNWISGNLRLHAVATDNVAVTKIQFYINNTLVAEESAAEIVRIWMGSSTPAGTYTLKARAYDAAGNYSESSLNIIKS